MTRRWNIKAVLLGALVDLGGSFLAGMLVFIVAGVIFGSTGATPEQTTDRLQGTGILALQAIVGAAFSLVGGYVAARISKAGELQHALASAGPCLAVGIIVGTGSLPALGDHPNPAIR